MRIRLYVASGVGITPSSPQGNAAEIGPDHRHRLPAGKEGDAIPGDYHSRSDAIAATIGGIIAVRDANVNTQAV